MSDWAETVRSAWLYKDSRSGKFSWSLLWHSGCAGSCVCYLLRGFTWVANAAWLNVLQFWLLPYSFPKLCEHQATIQVFYGSKLFLGCFQLQNIHANRIKMCWSFSLTLVFSTVQGAVEASACPRSAWAMSRAICKMNLDMRTALLQLVFCACYASVEEAQAGWFKAGSSGCSGWVSASSRPLASGPCLPQLSLQLHPELPALTVFPNSLPSLASVWCRASDWQNSREQSCSWSQQAEPLEVSELSSRRGLQGRPTESSWVLHSQASSPTGWLGSEQTPQGSSHSTKADKVQGAFGPYPQAHGSIFGHVLWGARSCALIFVGPSQSRKPRGSVIWFGFWMSPCTCESPGTGPWCLTGWCSLSALEPLCRRNPLADLSSPAQKAQNRSC